VTFLPALLIQIKNHATRSCVHSDWGFISEQTTQLLPNSRQSSQFERSVVHCKPVRNRPLSQLLPRPGWALLEVGSINDTDCVLLSPELSRCTAGFTLEELDEVSCLFKAEAFSDQRDRQFRMHQQAFRL
jgi:hypothetical protein